MKALNNKNQTNLHGMAASSATSPHKTLKLQKFPKQFYGIMHGSISLGINVFHAKLKPKYAYFEEFACELTSS